VLWCRSEYIYQSWEGKTVAPYYTAEYSVLCAIELNHVFIIFRSAANLAGSVQQVGQGTADSGAPSLFLKKFFVILHMIFTIPSYVLNLNHIPSNFIPT